jgi:hypothetical protein
LGGEGKAEERYKGHERKADLRERERLSSVCTHSPRLSQEGRDGTGKSKINGVECRRMTFVARSVSTSGRLEPLDTSLHATSDCIPTTPGNRCTTCRLCAIRFIINKCIRSRCQRTRHFFWTASVHYLRETSSCPPALLYNTKN